MAKITAMQHAMLDAVFAKKANPKLVVVCLDVLQKQAKEEEEARIFTKWDNRLRKQANQPMVTTETEYRDF